MEASGVGVPSVRDRIATLLEQMLHHRPHRGHEPSGSHQDRERHLAHDFETDHDRHRALDQEPVQRRDHETDQVRKWHTSVCITTTS
jgi:hypothetical protein